MLCGRVIRHKYVALGTILGPRFCTRSIQQTTSSCNFDNTYHWLYHSINTSLFCILRLPLSLFQVSRIYFLFWSDSRIYFWYCIRWSNTLRNYPLDREITLLQCCLITPNQLDHGFFSAITLSLFFFRVEKWRVDEVGNFEIATPGGLKGWDCNCLWLHINDRTPRCP